MLTLVIRAAGNVGAIGAVATRTRSPFATDASNLSGVVPYQDERTGPYPQGRPKGRRDLADVATAERRRHQEDNVDRVGFPRIDVRQLDEKDMLSTRGW